MVARAQGTLRLPRGFPARREPRIRARAAGGSRRSRDCRCDDAAVARYDARLSGPLLDRIDLHVHVPGGALARSRAARPAGPTSARGARPASRARGRARRRRLAGVRGAAGAGERGDPGRGGRAAGGRDLRGPRAASRAPSTASASRRAPSHRVLRVARSVADLAEEPRVEAAARWPRPSATGSRRRRGRRLTAAAAGVRFRTGRPKSVTYARRRRSEVALADRPHEPLAYQVDASRRQRRGSGHASCFSSCARRCASCNAPARSGSRSRARPGGRLRPPRRTLLDLVRAVSEQTEDDREVSPRCSTCCAAAGAPRAELPGPALPRAPASTAPPRSGGNIRPDRPGGDGPWRSSRRRLPSRRRSAGREDSRRRPARPRSASRAGGARAAAAPAAEGPQAPEGRARARDGRRPRAPAARHLGLGVLRQEPPPARLRQPVEGAAHHRQGRRRQRPRRLRGGRDPARRARRDPPARRDALPCRHRGQRARHRARAGAEDLRPAALRLEVPPPAPEPRPAGHRHQRRRDVRAAHHREADRHHHAHRRQAAPPTTSSS